MCLAEQTHGLLFTSNEKECNVSCGANTWASGSIKELPTIINVIGISYKWKSK